MIRLFIDGREIPADCTGVSLLDYDSSSLSDVESGRSASKATVTVPSTPETDALFGNAGNPLTADRFNDKSHRAVLTADGVEMFAGTALLAGTEHRRGGTLYKLEIRGDTALWARSAALKKVSDAQLKFSGEMTPDDIRKGWSDNRPVKFFPVNRAAQKIENSSVSLMPALTVTTPDDYWPFISVEAVVRALFADAGYSIESRFMESPLFRSLWFSGAWNNSVNAALHRQKMNFLAGRTADAEAVADYFGRVYLTVAVGTNSTGNIADTVAEYAADADGTPVATGFFSNGNCFYIDEQSGTATFRPSVETVVGFEYDISYVTDYVIRSRTELTGFNSIHLGNGITVPFKLENRFADQRSKPLGGYSYRLMLFDFEERCSYRLTATADGENVTLLETTQRMTPLTMPAADSITGLRLWRAAEGSKAYTLCRDDWALYWGFVTERGQTEARIRVTSPAERISPSSVKRFNEIFIDGAEPGMRFRLLKRTTVRPVFSSSAGYGSTLAFRDVAASDIRQSDLLRALQQMFDLQFCTDELSKRVFIEPYDDFFTGGVVDWRWRIDRDLPVVVSDPSHSMHEAVTLGYAEDDSAVNRFNSRNDTRLGRWTFNTESRAALDGESARLNPLFSPTVSESGSYFEAQSASIMQVRDTDEITGDPVYGNFSPRIVRYAGKVPLAEGEEWASSSVTETEYPLAAFHFAGGDAVEGFTLCFEDRDGLAGLHRFWDRHLHEISEGVEVTLWLRMLPEEAAALVRCCDDLPSVRSLFRLDADGRSPEALFTLRKIEGYDPEKAAVRCKFLKTEKRL